MDTAKLLLEQGANPGFIGNVSSITILLYWKCVDVSKVEEMMKALQGKGRCIRDRTDPV